jgi:hypothetical protein
LHGPHLHFLPSATLITNLIFAHNSLRIGIQTKALLVIHFLSLHTLSSAAMDPTGSTLPGSDPTNTEGIAENKGKGKAVAEAYATEDTAMDEDDDEDEEEEEEDDDEDDEAAEAAEEEDGMEEIDLDNIVEGGRRTRGQQIDFAKAAAENPADDDDEDEDDDDFQPPDDDTKMSD